MPGVVFACRWLIGIAVATLHNFEAVFFAVFGRAAFALHLFLPSLENLESLGHMCAFDF